MLGGGGQLFVVVVGAGEGGSLSLDVARVSEQRGVGGSVTGPTVGPPGTIPATAAAFHSLLPEG